MQFIHIHRSQAEHATKTNYFRCQHCYSLSCHGSKKLCAFTCLNQKTPLIAHEWRTPRYHEGLTKALKFLSLIDTQFAFPFLLRLFQNCTACQIFQVADLVFNVICNLTLRSRQKVSVFSVGFRFQTNDLISLSNHTSLGTWPRKN